MRYVCTFTVYIHTVLYSTQVFVLYVLFLIIRTAIVDRDRACRRLRARPLSTSAFFSKIGKCIDDVTREKDNVYFIR